MSAIPPDKYRGFIVDIDGVLVRGAEPVLGAAEALSRLSERGHVVLLSNNATRTRRAIAERLRSLGFEVNADMVVNSASIVAARLKQEMGPATVVMIGETGLRQELELAGHAIVEPDDADVVVTGMDRELTYGKLADALRALVRGARYVATNADATFPTPDGPTPGAGAIVGALRGMGFPPQQIVGKPSVTAFEIAMETLGIDEPSRCLVIGDRMETDIEGALNAGCDAALVLTGVTECPPDERDVIRPTLIADGLAELVQGFPS